MIGFQSFKLIMSYPLLRLAACKSEVAPCKSTYSEHRPGRKELIISLCLSLQEHPLDPAPCSLFHVALVHSTFSGSDMSFPAPEAGT